MSDLDSVSVSCRVANDGDEQGDVDVEVDRRYVGVGYCASVTVASVCVARDAARERLLHAGECDFDNVETRDYFRQE